MNRVKDYIRFTVWFVGLGYVALWPLTVHDNGVAVIAAALCGQSLAPMDLVCASAPALRLSPGLHLLGQMSAFCVFVRLLLRPLRRFRIVRKDGAAPGPSVPSAPAVRWPDIHRRNHDAAPPPRAVRPRRHFGLRGAPH